MCGKVLHRCLDEDFSFDPRDKHPGRHLEVEPVKPGGPDQVLQRGPCCSGGGKFGDFGDVTGFEPRP